MNEFKENVTQKERNTNKTVEIKKNLKNYSFMSCNLNVPK